MNFTREELQALLFLVRGVQRGSDVSAAKQHPAFETLRVKVENLEAGKEVVRVYDPATVNDSEVRMRAAFLRQGYTEREVDRMMPLLLSKKKEG